MTRFGRLRDGLMLMGIVMALFGGMALAMAAGLFVGGAKDVKAQVPPAGHEVFQLCKEWRTNGTGGASQTFFFDVSDISETQQFGINATEGAPPNCILLAAWPGFVEITEIAPGPSFLQPSWDSDTVQEFVGSTALFFLSSGGCSTSLGLTLREEMVQQVSTGTIRCIINFYNSDTEEPDPLASFQLCKDWDSNGVLSGTRTFVFDVSDISQTREVSIPNVVEGGQPVCVTVQAPPGPIEINEQEPDNFDDPDWYFGDQFITSTSGVFDFGLLTSTCGITTQSLVVREEQAINCTITVVNEDNDVPTVTSTPTIVVCPRCNTVTATVPPPTSTPTPPPATATQPPPTATQPPPTATPTSISGGTGGLTDAQRTQTAVAAARTAAAQQTPLPPRTGLGGADGAGGGTGVNIALFAIGLVVLSGGLGLVAVRSRR